MAFDLDFFSQPHSSLNRFTKEEDTKSMLVITLLSLVEAIRPLLCVFENVRGFVDWKLMGMKEDGKQRIAGGIEKGGLKLLLRCLIGLGYVLFASL
jgi:DNA (cytosine-5)-methyltransferase 1